MDWTSADSAGDNTTEQTGEAAEKAALEEAPTEEEGGYEKLLGKLDLQLTYLWRVHGVDYYAGKENAEPGEYEAKSGSRRLLRGPRPEEGEQADEAEGKTLTALRAILLLMASSANSLHQLDRAPSMPCTSSWLMVILH